MPFVLDCSVAMAWGMEEEQDDFADAVLDHILTDRAVVPAIWPLEVANVLAIAERRRRLSSKSSDEFISKLQNLSIILDEVAPQHAFTTILGFARNQGLTAYDAAYLELASRLRLPLASLDAPLLKAAKAAGVPAFTP